MKKSFFFSAIFFLSLTAYSTLTEKIHLPQQGLYFNVGESIHYDIRYGFIKAGLANLTIDRLENIRDRKTFHIFSEARTRGPFDLFFKVRDRNDSWLDIKNLCSVKFQQRIQEGKYRKNTWNEFDYKNGRVIHKYTRRKRKKVYEHIEKIPPRVQDVLSSLYYLRTQTLSPQQTLEIPCSSGGKNWPMKVIIKDIEMVKIPAGKFKCYRIEPVLKDDGLFKKTGKLEVWMTADERKIPILMKSKIMIGSIQAIMTKYVPPQPAEI